jgi:hypothetical protein
MKIVYVFNLPAIQDNNSQEAQEAIDSLNIDLVEFNNTKGYDFNLVRIVGDNDPV